MSPGNQNFSVSNSIMANFDNPHKEKSTSNFLEKTARGILNTLPEGATKNGLTEYFEVIGANRYYNDNSAFMENVGISAYFARRFSDPMNSCVRDAALNFYKEVALRTKSDFLSSQDCAEPPKKSSYVLTPDYGCSTSERAGIQSVAGEGQYKKFPPGWLWDLALKHAKGDPNSAMFLIGMCGHDDVNQGTYLYDDYSERALDTLRKKDLKFLSKKVKFKLR